MANLTIRRLDDAIRDELRLRAARNGRSVGGEVRGIPREAAQKHAPAPSLPAPAERPAVDAGNRLAAVTLIIGGGIAAYKSLDLIRRLKERRIEVRCVLTKRSEEHTSELQSRFGISYAV